MEEDEPLLEEATFKFSQDANCLDGEREYKTIEISIQSSLGLDRDCKGNHFFVVKTDSWSLDRVDDLQSLFARCENILKTSSANRKSFNSDAIKK